MLKRCINIEPKFTPAYIELAKLRGPADRSIHLLLRQIVELSPTNSFYITSVGNWLLENGKSYCFIKIFCNLNAPL